MIVDDFSTDSTYAIAKSYERECIIVLHNKTKGKNSAFNLAYLSCSGKYICFLAGDDELTNNSISSRYYAASSISNPNVVVLSKLVTMSTRKGMNGIIIPRSSKRGNDSGGCLLISKDFAEKVFPLPPSLPNEDNWINLHIRYFSCVKINNDNVVLKYRIHDQNSLGLCGEFGSYSMKLNERHMAYHLFYIRYHDQINEQVYSTIVRHILMEKYRFLHMPFAIMFIRNVALRDKVHYIFNSDRQLYHLKTKFYYILSFFRF